MVPFLVYCTIADALYYYIYIVNFHVFCTITRIVSSILCNNRYIVPFPIHYLITGTLYHDKYTVKRMLY